MKVLRWLKKWFCLWGATDSADMRAFYEGDRTIGRAVALRIAIQERIEEMDGRDKHSANDPENAHGRVTDA